MDIKQAEIRFRMGDIKNISIKPAFGEAGWYVEILNKHGRAENIKRQRGGDAIYKSLDAAWAAVRKIGFIKCTIETSGLA